MSFVLNIGAASVTIEQNRSIALDFLRAIAVLLVLFRHFPMSLAEQVPWMAGLQTGGWIGVDLFFVLSGYLVSGLLLNEWRKYGRVDVLRFIVRRALKIYPAFYVMIACTVLMLLIKPGAVSLPRLLVELFFLQSYLPGLWNHTWSLAVEEHFYFVIAIAAVLVNHKTWSLPRVMWVGAVCVCLLCQSFRLLGDGNYQHETHLYPTHLRLDALSFGVLLRCLAHAQPQFRPSGLLRLMLMLGALALASWPFYLPLGSAHWISSIGLSALSLAAMSLILALRDWTWFERQFWVRGLARLGFFSYSIYLWHMLLAHVYFGVQKRLFPEVAGTLQFFGYFVVTLGGGVLLAKLIELPVLALRERWYPSRTFSGKGVPSEKL